MKYFFALGLCLVVPAIAQQDNPVTEQYELEKAINEAGTSKIDFIRALERHISRYPKSGRMEEIERAIFKTAAELNDDSRIITYGEKLITRGSADLEVLDRVTRSLLTEETEDRARKALEYANRLEERLRANEKDEEAQKKAIQSDRDRAMFRRDMDRSLGRALFYKARATGILGDAAAGADLAKRSFDFFPTVESAREAARWLIAAKNEAEALHYLADAFTLPDARESEAVRAQIRTQMGALYTQLHGSEKGLGDLILEAYDRNLRRAGERKEVLRRLFPNFEVTEPMEFTLTGLDGQKLRMPSLKGKVVVLDFWATWCGPCRAQYPLYEEVKKRFSDRDDVVFLAINTDEDRSVVAPFVKNQQWNKAIWFDDGLANLLRVNSIPTTVIFNREGEIASRFNGFVPERFVDMLSERIKEALGE